MFEIPNKKELETFFDKDTSVSNKEIKEMQKRLFKTKTDNFCYALRIKRKGKEGQKGHIGYIGGITYSCLQSFYDQLTSIKDYAKKLLKNPDDQESKKALNENKERLVSKIKELSKGLDEEYMVMLDLDKFSIKMFSMKLSSISVCLLNNNRYENLMQRADDLLLFYLNSRNFKPEEKQEDAEKLTDLLKKTIDPENLIDLLQK